MFKSFLLGVASILDLGATLKSDPYILSDHEAIASDWQAVNDDLQSAIDTFESSVKADGAREGYEA